MSTNLLSVCSGLNFLRGKSNLSQDKILLKKLFNKKMKSSVNSKRNTRQHSQCSEMNSQKGKLNYK